MSAVYGDLTIDGNEAFGQAQSEAVYASETGFVLSYYGGYGDRTAAVLMTNNVAQDLFAGFEITVPDVTMSGSSPLVLTFVDNKVNDYQETGYRITGLKGGEIRGNTASAKEITPVPDSSVYTIYTTRTGMSLSDSVPDVFAGNTFAGNVTPVDPNMPDPGGAELNDGSAGLVVSWSDEASSQLITLADQNDIAGNDVGVRLEGYAQVVLTGNELGDNTEFGVVNLTPYEVDAREN